MNLAPPHPLDRPTEARSFRIWLLTAALAATILAAATVVATLVSAPPADAAARATGAAKAAPLPCDALDDLALPEVTQITAQLVTRAPRTARATCPRSVASR